MLLPPRDVNLLFRLNRTLMFFVNQQRQVLPEPLASPDEFAPLAPGKRFQVRDALEKHPDLLQAFIAENPAQLPADEIDVVRSWQHRVAGKFYVFRELKKYTVFLGADGPPTAYGVLALSQPFEEFFGPNLPALVDTVLLPFKGVIVYDGLMNSYRISFGAGIRRSLNERYQEAKDRQGILTSLPPSDVPPSRKATARPKAKASKDPAAVLQTILGLIEPFCREQLNEDYAVVCRKLAEKLARKRPSPLLQGTPATWASGIVRTIGWVNFLSDSSQTPHMKMTDVDAAFGVSAASSAAKAKTIRTLLKVRTFDFNWTLPSRMDDNPMLWMLSVNGFLMDVRHAPREVQEIAFAKGLIPYIPADRQPES